MAVQNEQVMHVGDRIRKLRKSQNLTQSDLAQRIGIQQSDLSRMERGKYRVSLDTLFKVLCEFEMTITDFFGEDSGLERGQLRPREARLVDHFANLNRKSQDEVHAFIEFKRRQQEEARS